MPDLESSKDLPKLRDDDPLQVLWCHNLRDGHMPLQSSDDPVDTEIQMLQT